MRNRIKQCGVVACCSCMQYLWRDWCPVKLDQVDHLLGCSWIVPVAAARYMDGKSFAAML